MVPHDKFSKQDLFYLIKSKSITWAGNHLLKIYGTLHCKSGKRMKKENRIFFESEKQAISEGFRPCAHCLHKKYIVWKLRSTSSLVD